MEETHTLETPDGVKYTIRGGDEEMLRKVVEKFQTGTLQAPDGSNLIHMAAAVGSVEQCHMFSQSPMKFDINGASDKGETPLIKAILHKNQETALFLVEKGADVTRSANNGETPLHHAAERGTKKIVELLISKGADVHANSYRGTPLHYAASAGNHETMACLLEHKADPNPNSTVDSSPFFDASVARSFECLELLLKAGADPNKACYLLTPLCFAAIASDGEIVRFLLKAGADPDMLCPVGLKALEYAAYNDCPEMVELLFPVTSCITCYPDWSISGVMQHAKAVWKSKEKQIKLLTKAKGGDAVIKENYFDAVQWYTQARITDPTDAKILSNRSLCYTKIGSGRNALKDALDCIALEPGWAKAHYREGAAWKVLKEFKKAAKAFSQALALDPRNKDINKELRAMRAELKKNSN